MILFNSKEAIFSLISVLAPSNTLTLANNFTAFEKDFASVISALREVTPVVNSLTLPPMLSTDSLSCEKEKEFQ